MQKKEGALLTSAWNSLTVEILQDGVKFLLSSLEEQMSMDLKKEMRPWEPRSLGFTVFQRYVDVPEVKSGIWSVGEAVERHFVKSKIVSLVPRRFPPSHSGWQFFMSGAGDTTNAHIDPPLTRSVFWQVIGYKLWCIWPATTENLAAFEERGDKERTWEWAIGALSASGRKLFIMEPGTWWELKQSEIHACISLTPLVHAAQEFFYVDDTEEILRVWKDTKEARQKSTTVTTFPSDEYPDPLADWLPSKFDVPEEELEPMVKNAMDLYRDGLEMVMEGKSDNVTGISEVCAMLPLVRLWIEKHALSQDLE